MGQRYFNWKLFIVLVLGVGVLAVTAIGLRHWQRGRRAHRGFTLGNEAYEQGRWKEAASQLGRYLSINLDDVPVLMKYADAQFNIRPLQSGNIQQAIGAYRNVLRLSPGHLEAAIRLSQLYLSAGDPGDAEQVANRALQSVQSPALRRVLAMAFAGQRKFQDAAAELEKIIKDKPDEIPAYESLGKLIEQRPEDFDVAPVFWFDEAVRNNPDSPQPLVFRGEYYLRQGQVTQALADFELATAKKFDDPNVRIQLAEQFIDAGRLEQAREHLEKAEGQAASNQMLWRIWALLAIKSGSKELMAEVARRGSKELAMQPWDFMPIAAELYIRSGQLEQAANFISQLHQKDISPPSTEFLRGLLADAKGQPYEAVKYWQRALELGGGTDSLRLALAKTFFKLGDTQSAIKQLRVLVSERPELVAARVELARLLGEVGRWAESAEQARITVELAPKDPNAAFAYALARSRLLYGQTDRNNSQDKAELERYVQKLEADQADSIELKLLKLQLAVGRSDFNEAQNLLNQVKNSFPSDIRVAAAEADVLVAQDKTGEAVAILTDAVEKNPDSVPLVRALVGLLSAQGARQSCVDVISRAMAQSRMPSVRKQMGLLLAGLFAAPDERARRCELLSRLYQEFPDDIPVLREMLTCPSVIENSSEAQRHIEKIRALEGDAGWQWRYEQAKIWFFGDAFNANYPQLLALLKENLLNDPDNQPSRMLLAAAYEKAKDTRLAIATYEEAMNRSPGDVRLMIQAASAMYRAGEYDRADQIIRKFANVKYDSPQMKRLQLQSFIRRGEMDSAGDVLENIFASDPNNRSVGLSLALLKMQRGQLDDAEKLLNVLIASEPNFPPVTAAIIELNLRKGDSVQAIRICDGLVERTGNAGALVLRGKTYALLGQNDRAEADFERAISLEPNNIDALLARSDFYHSAGRYVEAVLDIKRALVLEPDNIRIQKRAVLLYLADDSFSGRREGLNLLEKSLQAHPDDVELRLYKAHWLIAQDTTATLEQARSILKDIKDEFPMTSEAWKLLAETALRQGRPTDALDVVLEGLVRLPKDKPLLLLKAQIEGQRSPQLAVPTLLALHELDPNDIQTTVYLADMLVASGQDEEAIDLLRSQLNSHNVSDDRRLLGVALGSALYKSGRHNEASEIFDSLEKSSPDNPAPFLEQVRLLAKDKMWDRIDRKIKIRLQSRPGDVNILLPLAQLLASNREDEPVKITEDLLGLILKSEPDSSAANYLLATLLQNNDRPDEAAEIYKRLLKIDPDNVTALNNLAWILCENQKQYRQALELAERGLKKEPNYVDLLDTRGVALYRLGLFQRADEDLNRCVNLYPANTPSLAASYFHLARVQEKLGQIPQAAESVRKALDLNGATGGLTPDDLTEAQKLLEKLSQGG